MGLRFQRALGSSWVGYRLVIEGCICQVNRHRVDAVVLSYHYDFVPDWGCGGVLLAQTRRLPLLFV